jgi:hypothetical protein
LKNSDYVEAVKQSAFKIGKELLIREGLKSLPFLFTGPFGFVGTMITEKVMEVLIREGEFAVFFKYIDMRVDSQGSDFSKAAMENYRIQLLGTEAEKIEAEKKLIIAFKSFVKLAT